MTELDKRNQAKPAGATFRGEGGFTLMEVVVATTIFAVASVSLLSLFNYTLQINRRSEALRQATQGMRNFAEFLVKEVRNGEINYGVDGTGLAASFNMKTIEPCSTPGPDVSNPAGIGNTYQAKENRLGVTNLDGEEECVYLAYGQEGAKPYLTPVESGVFSKNTNPASAGYNPKPVLALKKASMTDVQVLTPPNFLVEQLVFFIRPLCDPEAACQSYGPGKPGIQPFVTIAIKFQSQLPTGETVPVYYQTTVSTSQYDITN